MKWSKTMQSRDKIHTIILPRLALSPLCPVSALKTAISMYSPALQALLFQIKTGKSFMIVTESRLRKELSKLIVRLGFPPSYFTFHSFRRSGATFAYNAHVPIQAIKSHGSWVSDCVWGYIQQDEQHSVQIASSFAGMIHG